MAVLPDAIARRQVTLVFDGAGARERAPVRPAGLRPGRRQDDELRALFDGEVVLEFDGFEELRRRRCRLRRRRPAFA